MQALPVIQVDAFTRTVFGGNPCAVVFDADGLDEATMQAIAREMNLSETAFVMESDEADWAARYFTPSEEIPMAGHPTIATVYGLLSTGRLQREGEAHSITLELPAGIIEVDIIGPLDGNPRITMTQLRPEFMRIYEPDEVAAAFGLTRDDLLTEVRPTTVSTGTPQLMVAVAGPDALRRAQVDLGGYRSLRDFGDFFSAHLFILEGATETGRTFARHFGVPPDLREDPFTGSATGAMGAYLWHHRLIDCAAFLAEQGHWMDRPGEAEVEVVGPHDDIRSVRVGGHAVEVMEGMILAPR